MYLRAVHSTFHLPTLYTFVKADPLGLLTTVAPREGESTIQSSHIPWVIDVPQDLHQAPHSDSEPGHDTILNSKDRKATGLPLGILRSHLSCANPQAKAIVEAARAVLSDTSAVDKQGLPLGPVTLPDEVLIIFTGPVQSYVTPKYYTATKTSTGKVVPTWNYEAV